MRFVFTGEREQSMASQRTVAREKDKLGMRDLMIAHGTSLNDLRLILSAQFGQAEKQHF
jgi:hypothetical protein